MEKNTVKDAQLSFKLKILILALWLLVKFLQAVGRIKVRGIENLRTTNWENRLLLANHPSYLETVLIPLVGFMPKMVSDPPRNFPWQTPNLRTVESSFLSKWKGIPLVPLKTDDHGKPNDALALRKIIRQMKECTFIIFPEGTRSYHADEPRIKTASGVTIGQARGGIGFIVAHARPTVIPVLVKNMERVLPPAYSQQWKIALRVLFALWIHRIEIIFGKPLDLSRFFQENGKSRDEIYEEIGKEVMVAIAKLDAKKK